MTYEERVDQLSWSYDELADAVLLSEFEVKDMAKQADVEIQKLKELLYISYRHNKETSTKMNPFIVQQIEEVIKDT